MSRKIFCLLSLALWAYGQEPFFIGIAGGSCSGKTTLGRALQTELGEDRCAIVSMDSYYKPLAAFDKQRLDEIDFDHPNSIDFDLLHAHLTSLRSREAIALPLYNFSLSDRVGSEILLPKDIIIIEGFLLLTDPKIRSLLNVAVFLDADLDILALRRFERDLFVLNRPLSQVKENYFNRVEPGFKTFVAPTKQFATCTLNAKNPISELVKELQQFLTIFQDDSSIVRKEPPQFHIQPQHK